MSLRILALTACLALTLAPAIAIEPDATIDLVESAPGGMVYAVPKASPLRFAQMGQDGAEFSGTLTLTGDYIFGYQEGHLDDIGAFITFVPDGASRALLPYWAERGAPRQIQFSNADEALAALADPALVADVRAGKLKSTRGQATIIVDGYGTEAGCDALLYVAHFVRVEAPPQTIAQNEYASTSGCG